MAHPVIDPWHGGVEGLAPLVQSNTRWIAVHAALLVLFPLSALAISRPVWGIETTSARFAGLMLAVFGVVYAAFDTYAGLATGTVVRCAQDLSAAEQTGARLAVKGLFNGPIIGALYVVGTAAWTLGAGAVAYTPPSYFAGPIKKPWPRCKTPGRRAGARLVPSYLGVSGCLHSPTGAGRASPKG